MKTAIFTGSFDPFTIGHKNIADRALQLFDKLIILVGHNDTKHYENSIENRKNNIEKIYQKEIEKTYIKVDIWDGLIVDYCKKNNIKYIVKGVRNAIDFEYEKIQADINKELEGIETILLIAEPPYCNISSTFVKTLKKYGKDVTKYLP